MYGYQDCPFEMEREALSLAVQKEGDLFIYKRTCLGSEETRRLLSGGGRILINPVEPLNRPKAITPYLLISLEDRLVMEPRASRRIYLTFPVEIGVIISAGEESQVLDIFTLAKEKFTLYGEPNDGLICKYWKSPVHDSLTAVDALRQGVLELTLENMAQDWMEVQKGVFNAYGMKIYYNEDLVTMKAHMKIRAANLAETEFEDAPLVRGMEKALEIYTARKLLVTSTKFLMEHGL